MTAPTFDTLKYAEALKTAGVPDAQAKAQAEALADALQQGDLELEITKLRIDVAWIKWILTVGVVFYVVHWIGEWYVIVKSIRL